MPSAVVHLYVAYRLANQLEVKNLSDFYLGAVSPDAVNLHGFATQEIRYAAHIRSLNYSQWKSNCIDYLNKNKSKYLDKCDFLLGFATHILTDILWDEIAQPQLFKGLDDMGVKAESINEEKWKELYRFNTFLAGDWLYENVLPKLKTADCLEGITTVNAELLADYKNFLCDDYKDKISDDCPKICTIEMVDEVSHAVLTFLNDNIL